jgi:hypothetical protein
VIALAVARLVSQAPLDALTSDLAARISTAVSPATAITLEVLGDDAALPNAIAARLASSGIRIVDAADPVDGVPSVRVSCLANLRERACSADVTGAVRTTFIVTGPHRAGDGEALPDLVLRLRSTFSQRLRILDVVRADDDLLVLSPAAIARYGMRDGSWQIEESRPISPPRPWPRDVRGRLRVVSGKVEAFLPGVTCAGDVSSRSLSCSAREVPWPLEIEDASLDPARNVFRTPDGFAFYGIARLGGAAGARFLAATVDHSLAWVDDGRQSVATTLAGDDVVAVRVPCAAGSYVVASSAAATRDADLLTLFQATGRRLIPAGSPLVLPGKLTALWPAAGGAATVITHDRGRDRYDAYELAVSCSREDFTAGI